MQVEINPNFLDIAERRILPPTLMLILKTNIILHVTVVATC